MTKAGVSFTHLKNYKIQGGVLTSRNKSTQSNSQSVPNKVKTNSGQQGACSNVQSAFLDQVKASPAATIESTKYAIGKLLYRKIKGHLCVLLKNDIVST